MACQGELLGRTGALAEAESAFRGAWKAARQEGDRLLEAEVFGALGRLANGRQQPDVARRTSERGAAIARQAGHGRPGRVAQITLGLLAMQDHLLAQAEALCREVQESAAAQGDQWMEGIAWSCLADVSRQAGRLREGRAQYLRAVQLARGVADSRNLGLALGQLAALEHEAGRRSQAKAAYREALEILGGSQTRYEGLLLAGLATLSADLDLLEQAAAQLGRASLILHRFGPAAMLGLEGMPRAHLDLCRARLHPQSSESSRALESARALVAPFAGLEPLPLPARLLARALQRTEGSLAKAEGQTALRVAPDGRGFSAPRQKAVALQRRQSLSRVLLALARRREQAADGALSTAALIEAGWPGEHPSSASGAQRVRVAIATLRSMGLRRFLLTRGDGYLLDPRVPFRWERQI
jgi:tetratricopeptide (TPR) repeat protein